MKKSFLILFLLAAPFSQADDKIRNINPNDLMAVYPEGSNPVGHFYIRINGYWENTARPGNEITDKLAEQIRNLKKNHQNGDIVFTRGANGKIVNINIVPAEQKKTSAIEDVKLSNSSA
jgi:hypothetical protein